ncbi:MAG: HAD family phosphatase [Candidatus Woesearchaeota archaeon]|jgi:phosphoserine phosphatase|nr:HAD family phosphatase [Candidatus Woesearchaeota archaeon]
MKYKLVCFDVDGTLIDNVVYSWELFHDYFKTDTGKRAEAREKFFSGKITYEEWALHDIELWKEAGARREDLVKAIKHLKLMEGAMEVINELKSKGVKLCIISGSINIIPETLIPGFSDLFDDIYLNKMSFNSAGEITDIKVTEFDIDGKAEALKIIAAKEGVTLDECVFVGDHLNDLKILEEAGLGIAFDPKDDKLREVADVVIEKKDLREVLRYVI